jgi:hypothetical protein
MNEVVENQKAFVLGEILVRSGEDILDADVVQIAKKVHTAFDQLEKERRDTVMNNARLVLSAQQIQELARFVEVEGQESYTVCYGEIPAQGDMPEYSGLIAFSGNEKSSILALME